MDNEYAPPRPIKRQRKSTEDSLLETNSSPLETTSSDHDNNDVFPTKLMKIIDDEQNVNSIRWSQDGSVFGINQTQFEAEVMTKHFHGSKYASFVRRLSRWGFERTVREEFPLDWIVYRHHLFRRGNAGLLKNLTSGQMYEINALKEEEDTTENNGAGNTGVDNTGAEATLNPTALPSNLIALGSESRVASLSRDHVFSAGSFLDEGLLRHAQRGPVLTAVNDGTLLNLLRTQGKQQEIHPSRPSNNSLHPALSAQHTLLSNASITQAYFNDSMLNTLTFDQLSRINSQIENRRLLALLQSQTTSNTSIVDALFPALHRTGPSLHSNLLEAFELIQQGREFLQNTQLSKEDIVRYLLYSQNRE